MADVAIHFVITRIQIVTLTKNNVVLAGKITIAHLKKLKLFGFDQSIQKYCCFVIFIKINCS